MGRPPGSRNRSAYPRRREPPPPPPPSPEGDLRALREAAEAILAERAGDVSAYGKGLQAAAVTLAAAAGLTRDPRDPTRLLGREERAALEGELGILAFI